MPLPVQPELPIEIAFTDAEFDFLDHSPPGLYPENQDSNFGLKRLIWTARVMELIMQQFTIYQERFVPTSSQFLNEWEYNYGLPPNPTGVSIDVRRSHVLGRKRKGLFSRSRLRELLGEAISLTFGSSVELTPLGVALDSGGVPLYADAVSIIGTFRVYENFKGYSYQVWIKSSITPDIVSLTRELLRITPSGMSFTIDNTHADVLNYALLSGNLNPYLYLRLGGNANDASFQVNNGTLNGAPTFAAAPGLLAANVAGGDQAMNFDGVNDYVSVPNNSIYNFNDKFSVSAWIKPTGGLAVNPRIISKGGSAWEVFITAAGALRLQKVSGAVVAGTTADGVIVAGNTYHIAVTKDGSDVHMYVNGVDVGISTGTTPSTVMVDNTNAVEIGRLNGSASNFFTGVMDEVALFNRALSPAEAADLHNTGIDVATY